MNILENENMGPKKETKSYDIYKMILETDYSSYKIAKLNNTYPSVVLGVANRYYINRFSKKKKD